MRGQFESRQAQVVRRSSPLLLRPFLIGTGRACHTDSNSSSSARNEQRSKTTSTFFILFLAFSNRDPITKTAAVRKQLKQQQQQQQHKRRHETMDRRVIHVSCATYSTCGSTAGFEDAPGKAKCSLCPFTSGSTQTTTARMSNGRRPNRHYFSSSCCFFEQRTIKSSSSSSSSSTKTTHNKQHTRRHETMDRRGMHVYHASYAGALALRTHAPVAKRSAPLPLLRDQHTASSVVACRWKGRSDCGWVRGSKNYNAFYSRSRKNRLQ